MGMNHKQCGFTLIEIMLAAVITAILMVCVISFTIQGSIMLETSKKENEVQQNLVVAMDKITRELLTSEQLRFVDEQVGFQPEKDDKVLTFTCNKNLVIYCVDEENELSRSFSGVDLPIANYVKSLSLRYYDTLDEEISPGTPAFLIETIKIELTGGTPGVKDITLTGAVTLRTENR